LCKELHDFPHASQTRSEQQSVETSKLDNIYAVKTSKLEKNNWPQNLFLTQITASGVVHGGWYQIHCFIRARVEDSRFTAFLKMFHLTDPDLLP
jgi:hypothetical protein